MVLKESIREYTKDFDTTNCFGVSLTLKQRVDHKSLTNDISNQNLTHFLNVLNKRCFGNSFKRFNKKLRVLPVLEKSSNGRLHYHLTLQNPFPEDPYKFESMINFTWFKTNYGHRHIHIHRNVNEGWNDYITKLKTSDDEVDWINFSS